MPFAVPFYCCMLDHFHFIWMGILSGSDQRIAVKYFRKQLNLVLKKGDFKLQNQSYDHVLKEEERIEAEFANVVEYIARNPERQISSRRVILLITSFPAVSFPVIRS